MPPVRDLGVRYDLRFNHVFAGSGFESALRRSSSRTRSAGLDVPAGVHADGVPAAVQRPDEPHRPAITTNKWIDGPATEQKLGDLAVAAGIDVTKPTIFFVNASGVGNHTYVKTDVVDPDTGYNFGVVRASRKATAWGGTPTGTAADTSDRRVWFYDLSAGPEGWTDNWDVDNADVDGDGERDYRIPPLWHYQGPGLLKASHPGYAGTTTLGADLGKVTRYVALNLLFASSPLYPPYFQPNRIPSNVVLDVNTVEWWNNVDVSSTFIKPSFIQTALNGLPAGPAVTVGANQDLPFSGDWARCYQGFSSDKKLCFNDLASGVYAPFANPFLAAARNQSAFLPTSTPVGTYRAALINWGVGTKPKTPGGLLGFADDNWLNGTQSGVFSFVYPEVVPLGYGMTTTMTHEYGHHSSMSHPHDGYDSATGVDYGPGGDTQYAWLGDMSDSIMSYLDLADGFSQFDQDNSARHHAAGYAKIAKELAAPLGPVQKVADANVKLGLAQAAWAVQDYSTALGLAKGAYEDVVSAWGGAANVPILTTRDLVARGSGQARQRQQEPEGCQRRQGSERAPERQARLFEVAHDVARHDPRGSGDGAPRRRPPLTR